MNPASFQTPSRRVLGPGHHVGLFCMLDGQAHSSLGSTHLCPADLELQRSWPCSQPSSKWALRHNYRTTDSVTRGDGRAQPATHALRLPLCPGGAASPWTPRDGELCTTRQPCPCSGHSLRKLVPGHRLQAVAAREGARSTAWALTAWAPIQPPLHRQGDGCLCWPSSWTCTVIPTFSFGPISVPGGNEASVT